MAKTNYQFKDQTLKATLNVPPSQQKHFEQLIRNARFDESDPEYIYFKMLKLGLSITMDTLKAAHDKAIERGRMGRLIKDPLYATAYTVAIQRKIDEELSKVS